MPKPNLFLKTKLLPPRAVSEFLSRPRLTEKLKANLNSPMTLVAADAGCGKTTLISDFIRQTSRQSVWYQLDHTDADPFVFLGYIAHGIKNFAPQFGENILPYLSEATDELFRFPERAVDLLLNEILETIEQPFILVLDDYHHIGRETIVHKLVDRLLQYSSEMLHLIITTRDLPPLATMRRRSQSAALILTREDLLFTDDEMRGLFKQTLDVEIADEIVREYRDRTHGWVTALQLVRQVAEQEIYSQSEKHPVNLRTILQQSEKDIFDYFAEEVFNREPEDTRNLLLHLSLLESLPLDDCSRLFPAVRCSAILPELLSKNIFLTVAGVDRETEVYRLHPLFRDFLQRRLRSEIGRVELEKERQRVADFYFDENQWEKALPFLFEVENYETASEVIGEKGAEWIESGAITTLDNFIGKIPLAVLNKYPRALLHKAEIARLRGEIEKSTNLLNRAIKLLSKNKDREGEAEALHSLASLLRRKGDYAAAFEYLEQAEQLVGEETETFLKCANTRGLCLVAQGAWTQAEHQFRYALELAERQLNEHFIRIITHNLALPAGFRGDFGEALRWFKRIFRDDKSGKPVPQEAIGHLNVARLHVFRGEFDEAERSLELSLEICQLYNLVSLRGEIFETYANLYRDKKDFQHATEFYERARKSYQDAGINPATRDLDEERAKFYLLQGDTYKARNLLENLQKLRAAAKNEFGIKTVEMNLCRVALAEGKIGGLTETLKQLTDFFREQNLNYDEANSALLMAQTLYINEKRHEMIEPLERALDLSARFDYEHWLRGEIVANREFFADEEVAEKLPPDLRLALSAQTRQNFDQNISETPVKSFDVQISEVSVVDLTVKTLGFVEIYRDRSKPFAADAWTTKRARDIFCYIATSPFRRVEKDVLIDIFWRDEDPETIEKNFHPTISHIRKALNSNQTFKQKYIVFRDGAYQLNPELVYSIDTEEFEIRIELAEKAKKEKNNDLFIENLEAAQSIFRGEFLAGVYEDWAEERRNYLAEQYARVINALAKSAFADKKWTKALKFINEILQLDPFREDAQRLMMKVYAAQGNRAAIIEQFETLQQLLKSDLGVNPAPETLRVYQELTK